MRRELLGFILALVSFFAHSEISLGEKINNRHFPSIFQAWTKMSTSGTETPLELQAKHDLLWQGPLGWGLRCDTTVPYGLCPKFSDAAVEAARAKRSALLEKNPKAILLAEIRHHDARSDYFPEDSVFWKRDANGNRIPKTNGTATEDYYLLDPANSGLQDAVASLCQLAVASGVVDGCMLDWWGKDPPEQVELVAKVRDRIGEKILVANVNGLLPRESAKFINGIFMEGFGAHFFNDWKVAKDNLLWAGVNLRAPAFTAFEAWGPDTESDGPDFRFPLALALVFSDGYFLFGDKMHTHSWHSLWEKNLGRPSMSSPTVAAEDGSYRRDFDNGAVILNPPGNAEISILFSEERIRASTGARGRHHSILPGDADLFFRIQQAPSNCAP